MIALRYMAAIRAVAAATSRHGVENEFSIDPTLAAAHQAGSRKSSAQFNGRDPVGGCGVPRDGLNLNENTSNAMTAANHRRQLKTQWKADGIVAKAKL